MNKMINTNKSKIFNYINYTILSCIVPIGYFAPLGEWLLISILSLSALINFLCSSHTCTDAWSMLENDKTSRLKERVHFFFKTSQNPPFYAYNMQI